MKKNILPLLVICLLLSVSCRKDNSLRFGFYCPIEKNSSGLSLMAVNRSADFIRLNGSISLQEGEANFTLTDPQGVVVLAKRVKSGECLQINEIFDATHGIWKLEYKSRQGIGLMDLHMKSSNKFDF